MSRKPTQSETSHRMARPVVLGMLLVGLLVVGVLVWLGGGRMSGGADGLTRAMRSAQFRLFFYLAIGSVVAMAVLGGVLFRSGLPWRKRQHGQSGTVILEFAMVFPFLLMIALMMIQSSLLMGGFLCVNYASYCAARSAVVYIPQRIDREEPNLLQDLSDPEASEKLWRIRQAAVWAVLPISDGSNTTASDYSSVMADGLDDLFTQYGSTPPGWIRNTLGRRLAYAEENTTVWVDPPIGGELFGEHEDIHVTVRHNLYLSVPYANRVLAALDSDHAVDLGDGKYALQVDIPCTLTNEGAIDEIDIEVFPDPE